MSLNFKVAEGHHAAETSILAFKLHSIQLLFDFLLDGDEARFLALHWALARLLGKLVKTDLVEALLALLALPGLDKNGGAECTEQVFGDLVTAHDIPPVQSEAHSLEIIHGLTLPIGSKSLGPQVLWSLLTMSCLCCHD